ncbi:Oidioi.mRNA.OKI2018_I69.chr1.g736.t1.cds [Oikopleura dioica]|uniref:Oidioi.mRNA.OKI2018_I69.chr1.g736.t1.cds n=1 Tax=Oikopleura dioica TaxID=34765 RepID=A0ABN7SS29_OIKDI|nr:Oidioi.mRNA.OKI2018_I69.chr1.g736.t1.cds [Oikopleura dioica]
MKKETKKKNKSPIICKYCGKHFNRNFAVKRHERIHTGEKPYQCDFCDVKFNQSGTLYEHKRRRHKKAQEALSQKQLKFRGRKIINEVVHYRICIDEEDKDENVKEIWVPIFDIEDFQDVVEFEKFMSGEL